MGTPSLEELVELCAVDNDLFARVFFPRTARQHAPPFHNDIWASLESPEHRLVNIQVFRGGAKTSIARMFTCKRISYGLAHTVLYIGKSENHASRSARWIKRQIQYNNRFSQTFNLRAGDKWQDTEFEIYHETDEYPIWIMAAGITGSIRGINFDDFRPDLIVVDDVIDEENSATTEQRIKIENLILGALKESLAPRSESPDAKMVMLQTPLNKEDASSKALEDPEWASSVFGCWTDETKDLALEKQESRWPERWTSEELRTEKAAAIQRNRISLWMREKECRLISPETSAFRPEWLKYYELPPSREEMDVVLVIDPVPPPSETQIAKGLRGKDYEAFAVVGRHKQKFFNLENTYNRGHDPNWTIAEFFRLAFKWRPRSVCIESVAYQRTLAWLIGQAMQARRQYYVIEEITDKRSKYDRIVDGLSGVASNGQLFVRREQMSFITQFTEYPDCSHDDVLETVAVGVERLHRGYDSSAYDAIMAEEEDIPDLKYIGGSP